MRGGRAVRVRVRVRARVSDLRQVGEEISGRCTINRGQLGELIVVA